MKHKLKRPSVVVVMGSESDLPVLKPASKLLKNWGVDVRTEVVSAHRTPELLGESVHRWEASGVRVIIAGAGGAAHLPGMLASYSVLPVIGVPVKKKNGLDGMDALLSIAQMPPGVPVATMAMDGAENAALMALRILGSGSDAFAQKISVKMKTYQKGLKAKVAKMRKSVSAKSKKF